MRRRGEGSGDAMVGDGGQNIRDRGVILKTGAKRRAREPGWKISAVIFRGLSSTPPLPSLPPPIPPANPYRYSFAINCLPREQSHFAAPNIITYLNHRSIARYLYKRERESIRDNRVRFNVWRALFTRTARARARAARLHKFLIFR